MLPPVTRAILPASFVAMFVLLSKASLDRNFVALLHGLHGVVGRQDRVREEAVVDERRLVAVADLGVPGAGRRVLHHGDLEPLLEQLAQVALDAQVRQHPGQDDLADAAACGVGGRGRWSAAPTPCAG